MAEQSVRDIRNMTDEQLVDAIEDQREKIFNLRFQKAANQLEDGNQLRYAKRGLARLLGIQHERSLEGEK
jgi:large subunit ribosomal protein L29